MSHYSSGNLGFVLFYPWPPSSGSLVLVNSYFREGEVLLKLEQPAIRIQETHNQNPWFFFFSGVFPCAKYDVLPKIDLLDCNVFSPHFGRDFGLNEFEMYELVGHLPSEKLQKIVDFYPGYCHSNQSKLANPYSIMQCMLNKGKFSLFELVSRNVNSIPFPSVKHRFLNIWSTS